jgi:hypothetical protein
VRSPKAYTDLADAVPGELLREPIEDADTPCPRCGGRDWLLVERRAEPDQPFTRWRAVACARCGGADSWTQAGRRRPGRDDASDDEPVWQPPQSLSKLVAAAEFDVYAAGPEPALRKVASFPDRIVAITVASGDALEITSALPPALVYPDVPMPLPGDAAAEARDQLTSSLVVEDLKATLADGLSEHAHDLRQAHRHRSLRARADAAPVREVNIDAPTGSIAFTMVQVDDCRVAATAIGDQTVTIVGRHVATEDVALEVLRTP